MDDSQLNAIKPDALGPAAVETKTEGLGVGKVNMATGQAFVLSILAGMFIGMGGMFMLLIKSDASLGFVASQLLGGLCFCLGLFLVITAGAELFTGNCLMICGKLSDKYSWGKMLKSWLIVFVGNLVGALILVGLLYFAGYWSMNGNGVGDAMITVACSKISPAWSVLFFKGIMCNFLVCLAVWVGFASRTIVDKFFAVLLPITAFVACGFEHCVANMFFLPMGFVMKLSGFAYAGNANIDVLTLGGICYNISAATLGNIVGGAIFVGLMYWLAYAKKNKKADAEPKQ